MTCRTIRRNVHPWAFVALAFGIAYATYISKCAGQEPVANKRPLPAEQWTPEAHHTLARCVVGEAGWTSRADHLAIADVLARRWRTRVKRVPGWRFVDQVRAYCKGLRPAQAARQWVKALPYGDGPWPEGAGRNQKHWRLTLARLDAWSIGALKSPCPRASHWGGDLPQDNARARRAIDAGKWLTVRCWQPTLNTFFRRAP